MLVTHGSWASLDILPWAGKGKRLGPLGETELPSLQRAKEQGTGSSEGRGQGHLGRGKNPPREREEPDPGREKNPSKSRLLFKGK